jgi:hypothetical protein
MYRTSGLVLMAVLMASQGSAALPPVDNVTLTLRTDASTVYLDGDLAGGSTTTQSFEQPYVSTSNPEGVIGLSEPLKLSYSQGSPDNLSVTQSGGEFLLASTGGGVPALEDDLDSLDSGFFDQVSPSFNFPEEVSDTVTLLYEFPYEVTRFQGDEEEFGSIGVRNRVTSDNDTELWLRTD